eukprot:5615116-Prymnesium_polylepis.1
MIIPNIVHRSRATRIIAFTQTGVPLTTCAVISFVFTAAARADRATSPACGGRCRAACTATRPRPI